MKKILAFILMISASGFSQSRFAIEADGGIDLVSKTDFDARNLENGYSFAVSPVYHVNETISVLGVFAFHRAEGGISGSGIMPAVDGYSIDNPDKPNIYAYEVAFGLRANFSDKIVKPYFSLRTGFLFTNVSHFSAPVYFSNTWYSQGWDAQHRIALFISPGLGVNFSLLNNLNFLIEARFNITTGTDYSFFPVTTGIQYRL